MEGGRIVQRSLLAAVLATMCCACWGGGSSASTTPEPTEGALTAAAVANSVIPWSPATAPPARPATPTPSPTPSVSPSVRQCGASDLDYQANSQGATGGQLVGWLTVSNRSSSDCFVSGRPLVVFFDAAGQAYAAGARGADPAAGPPVLVPAGTPPLGTPGAWPGRASVQVGWAANSDVCRTDIVKTAGARITFPDGSSLDIPEFRGSSCKGQISAATFKPVKVPAPGVLRPSLNVTVDAPATTHAGELLVYTVSLTNTSDFSAWFNGTCPVYRADFNAQAVRLTKARQLGTEMVLNCMGLDRIAPGQTIQFEMRLDIPADAAPGTYLIDWQLGGGFASLALAAKKIEVVAP